MFHSPISPIISMATSGTDWLEVPTIYIAYIVGLVEGLGWELGAI